MHTIRLADPWNYSKTPEPVFSRDFHWVAKLLPSENVALVFDGVNVGATVVLNGHNLGEIDSQTSMARFAIKELLRQDNQLEVTLYKQRSDTARRAGTIGEVHLEISEAI